MNIQTGFDPNDLYFLLLDIEASYALAYVFPSKREQYVPASSLKHGQFYPCAAYKRLGVGKTTIVKTTDNMKRFKKNFRDDYVVAKAMHDEMSKADVIIIHNSEFDMKHLNVAFRRHKLGAIPEKKVICTLKAARRYFAFAGNSLADLLREFGLDGKHEKPDWQLLTEGDEEQTNKAAKYCGVDVDRLEEVFLELRPFMRNLPIMKTKKARQCCDACGSKRLRLAGDHFYRGKIWKRVWCLECRHQMKDDVKYYSKK